MYQAIIIDDEKWVVQSLLATLNNLEHFEIMAKLHDGISAMEYLKKHQPDLAFVDVRLPGMSGLDILKEANSLGLKTLFIVISGHAEFEYAQKAMLHNAISYCLKPFSRTELTAAVDKAYELLEKWREFSKLPPENTPPSSSVPIAKNKMVQTMLTYTQNHYMDDISIQTLAELCAINPNYAGQLFKQEMNQTFSSYLTELRIRRAIHLLTSTDMPVALVAASVGYQDYFYFAKVFKKVTQATPSSYRHEEETS